MGKTTVQTVAEELGKLTHETQMLVNQMRTGQIGRRKAYAALKEIRSQINVLVGRLGSM